MEYRIKGDKDKMKVKCIKCEKAKELTQEELQEAGEFVEKRKLRAVGFLKVLSLDLRDVCTNGKEHVWEFEPSFDKEIHALAADVKNTKDVIVASEKEIIEYEKVINEMTTKMDVAKQRSIFNGDKSLGLLEKMKTIAWISDESLWT